MESYDRNSDTEEEQSHGNPFVGTCEYGTIHLLPCSFSEFMHIPDEFGEYELIEGTLCLMAPPSTLHGNFTGNFAETLIYQASDQKI